MLPDEEPGIAPETLVSEVVEVRGVERCGLRWVHTHKHVVRRGGNGSGAATLGSHYLRVIRLELAIDCLHGIVHRNLHERDVDDADGTGASHRGCLYGDLIPVGHGIGKRGCRTA